MAPVRGGSPSAWLLSTISPRLPRLSIKGAGRLLSACAVRRAQSGADRALAARHTQPSFFHGVAAIFRRSRGCDAHLVRGISRRLAARAASSIFDPTLRAQSLASWDVQTLLLLLSPQTPWRRSWRLCRPAPRPPVTTPRCGDRSGSGWQPWRGPRQHRRPCATRPPPWVSWPPHREHSQLR